MVFASIDASVGRLVPISSMDFVLSARRPGFSVLGHSSWSAIGVDGVSVPPMRDWKLALREAMPEIVLAVKAE